MMTIKEFATLCGCNTQTLRYYDKIDLLKPVKVDQWSGYRYYTKAQAIAFVKIKNLQAADFTIDEIKALLTMPDQQVCEAFDQKIAEQAQKLERIKEIQQSYLTEKTNMEKLVQSASDYLFHAVSDFEMLREFGMSPADGEAVIAKLKEFYEKGGKVAAICAAPSVFADLGFLKGRKATSYPSFMERLTGAETVELPVVTDGNVTTSRGLGTAVPFALNLIAQMRQY